MIAGIAVIAPTAGAGAASSSADISQNAAQEIGQRLLEAAAAHGARSHVTQWWFDNGTLHVGFDRLSGAEAHFLSAALGQRVLTSVEPRIQGLVKRDRVSKAPRLVHVKGQAKGAAQATATGTDPRLIDSAPYYSGDRIVSVQGQYVYSCTAGGKLMGGSSAYMATAGHCGPAGAVWYQGYYDQSTGTIWNSGVMGTAAGVVWGNNLPDGAILNGNTYGAYTWTTSNSYAAAHITGPFSVRVGTPICANGSYTGLSCGGTVTQINVCAQETEGSTSVTVCWLNIATASNRLTQAGDSGGPVLASYAGSTATLAGLISGGDAAGTTLAFADMGKIDSWFGTVVATS